MMQRCCGLGCLLLYVQKLHGARHAVAFHGLKFSQQTTCQVPTGQRAAQALQSVGWFRQQCRCHGKIQDLNRLKIEAPLSTLELD